MYCGGGGGGVLLFVLLCCTPVLVFCIAWITHILHNTSPTHNPPSLYTCTQHLPHTPPHTQHPPPTPHTQVLIVQAIPGVFKIDQQTWQQWLVAIAIGIGCIPFAFFIKLCTRGWNTLLHAVKRHRQKHTHRAADKFPPRTVSTMPLQPLSGSRASGRSLEGSGRALERNDSRRSQVSLTASATAEENVGLVFDLVCVRGGGLCLIWCVGSA